MAVSFGVLTKMEDVGLSLWLIHKLVVSVVGAEDLTRLWHNRA